MFRFTMVYHITKETICQRRFGAGGAGGARGAGGAGGAGQSPEPAWRPFACGSVCVCAWVCVGVCVCVGRGDVLLKSRDLHLACGE